MTPDVWLGSDHGTNFNIPTTPFVTPPLVPPSPEPVTEPISPPCFAALPSTTLFDMMMMLHTTPDSSVIMIHAPLWNNGPESEEQMYALPKEQDELMTGTELELELIAHHG